MLYDVIVTIYQEIRIKLSKNVGCCGGTKRINRVLNSHLKFNW